MDDFNITEKTIMAALQMYKDGIPVSDIAERVGKARPTIYNWLKRAGVKRDRRADEGKPTADWDKVRQEISR